MREFLTNTWQFLYINNTDSRGKQTENIYYIYFYVTKLLPQIFSSSAASSSSCLSPFFCLFLFLDGTNNYSFGSRNRRPDSFLSVLMVVVELTPFLTTR